MDQGTNDRQDNNSSNQAAEQSSDFQSNSDIVYPQEDQSNLSDSICVITGEINDTDDNSSNQATEPTANRQSDTNVTNQVILNGRLTKCAKFTLEYGARAYQINSVNLWRNHVVYNIPTMISNQIKFKPLNPKAAMKFFGLCQGSNQISDIHDSFYPNDHNLRSFGMYSPVIKKYHNCFDSEASALNYMIDPSICYLEYSYMKTILSKEYNESSIPLKTARAASNC